MVVFGLKLYTKATKKETNLSSKNSSGVTIRWGDKIIL
jgi:hypothetical protein